MTDIRHQAVMGQIGKRSMGVAHKMSVIVNKSKEGYYRHFVNGQYLGSFTKKLSHKEIKNLIR